MARTPGNIGGSFVADGTVRLFTTKRTRKADAPDGSWWFTWAELYHTSTGRIENPRTTYWKIGLKNLRTGKIFWRDGGSDGRFNLVRNTPAEGMRKGDSYVVACKYNARMVGMRVRFGGSLNVI